MRGLAALLCLVLIAASTSGCGWRLRGTVALPEWLDEMRVAAPDDANNLRRELRSLLQSNDVSLAEDGDPALVMRIDDYEEERRVISVGSGNLVSEYELTAEARYRVEDDRGNVLMPPEEATVIRSYQFDRDNVLAMEEEQRLIQEEMRGELAQQMLRRFRFLELDDTRTERP